MESRLARNTHQGETEMNARNIVVKALGLAALAGVVSQLVANAGAEENKKATATFSVKDLMMKRGPTPPIDSKFTGVQAQPQVGELKLPIHDAKVFKFMSKTTEGRDIPVNWAYQPGAGTYMWGTAKIQCANSAAIEKGGFAMQVHDDGSGAYALGTTKCPVSKVYGCRFDTQGMESQCGLCTWNQSELACVSD
jgi:hypothetical protein